MSVNEIAVLKVNGAQRAAFVESAHAFTKTVAADGGCRQVEMLQSIDEPDSFVVVITWDSREARKAFSGSDRGRSAISALAGHLVEPPTKSLYQTLTMPG